MTIDVLTYVGNEARIRGELRSGLAKWRRRARSHRARSGEATTVVA
jgi:hypothetical protein